MIDEIEFSINKKISQSQLKNTQSVLLGVHSHNREKYIHPAISLKLVTFRPVFKICNICISFEALFGNQIIGLNEYVMDKGFELNFEKFYVKVIDYSALLNFLFDDYIIKDCQVIRMERGQPDFTLISKKDKSEIYIEIKRNTDGISAAQLEWYNKHSNAEIYFLFIIDGLNKYNELKGFRESSCDNTNGK